MSKFFAVSGWIIGLLLAGSEGPYIVNVFGAIMFLASNISVGIIFGEGSVKNG